MLHDNDVAAKGSVGDRAQSRDGGLITKKNLLELEFLGT